jgi:hypothetical protein
VNRSPTVDAGLTRLLSLLRVEPEERRPLGRVWLLSLFSGLAIAPLFAAGNALFLSQFSSDSLPYAYIVAAALSLLAARLYDVGRRRLSTERLFRRVLLALLGVVLLLRLGLALPDDRVPAFLLLGVHSLTAAMLSVEVWGVAGRLFTVRQGSASSASSAPAN